MEHASEPLSRVIAGLNPHRRTKVYEASGRRVIRRGPNPVWLDLDAARREAFALTAALVRSDDPGNVLPRISQLAWAIRDASDDGSDPTPPASDAMAVPQEIAA